MGYFCDVGVLRTRVSSDLSFLELLYGFARRFLMLMPTRICLSMCLQKNSQSAARHPPDLHAFFMFEPFSEQFSRLGDLKVNQLRIATRPTMPWGFQMHVRDEGGHFTDGHVRRALT